MDSIPLVNDISHLSGMWVLDGFLCKMVRYSMGELLVLDASSTSTSSHIFPSP